VNFCFIPWIDWDFYLRSRPHHLVKEALGRGHRVLYLNPVWRAAQKEGNLEIWHPFSYGVFRIVRRTLRGELFSRSSSAGEKKLTPLRRFFYRPYEEKNRWTLASRVLSELLTRKKLRTFFDPGDRNVILFEQPFPLVYQIPYFKKQGWTVIYDMIDDWSVYADAPAYFSRTEPYLLQAADMITATSKTLYQKGLPYNKKTYLCPNAAEIDHFAKAREACERPKDLPAHQPRIGFFGIIREWFDVALLRYAALQRPGFEFCLIGGYSEEAFEQLKDLRNVHLLGERDYSVLPRYLHHFDVTIIPFVINDLIRSTNPIKVYEYLAGGRPVVATDIPEIENMPLVYPSKNPEEFVKNLDCALETPPDLTKVDAFLENQTWTKRFDVIAEAIASFNHS
jgi:glycosyltransferase involved in cell wall biosynthesis